MRIFESHAHFDDERFDADRDELLGGRLKACGVERVLNVSADMAGVEDSYRLAQRYDYIFCTVGVHPNASGSVGAAELDTLCAGAKREKVCAIGEIGLDYHYPDHNKEEQLKLFKAQLELARNAGKPVIIHSRDAHKETFDILKDFKAGETLGGVIHCYGGSAEMACEYVKLGFHIGVGGVVTYKNARSLVETVRAIPLERILVETDCPYLPPEPHRGERNDSTYLPLIVNKIAEIKNVTPEDVAETTFINAERLFLTI